MEPAPDTPSPTEPSLQAGHGSTHKPIETAGRPSEHIGKTLIRFAEDGESAQGQLADVESQSCSNLIEGSPITLTNLAESSATDKETQDKPRDWLTLDAVKDAGAAAEEHTSGAVEKTEAGHRALADTSARVSPEKVADRTLGARQEAPAGQVRVGQRAAGAPRARGGRYSVLVGAAAGLLDNALTGAAVVLLAGIWVYNAGPPAWAGYPLAPSATATAAHPPADLATTGTGQFGEHNASPRRAAASNPGTISGVPEVVDRESRPAKLILPAQPGPAAEAKVEEASITPIATPVLEEASVPPTPLAAIHHSLGSDEIAAYMAQARYKVEQGDIAAARRLIEHASNSDKAETWFALAETYDPKMLAQWGVRGVKPDLEKARALYWKAKALGDQGAQRRLLAIAN